MDITLIPAQEPDLPVLLKIARAAACAPGSHWDEDYPDEGILRWDLEHQGLYRIHGAGGALMGLISMGRLEEMQELDWPSQDSHACELSRLGLHPDVQGKGLLEPIFRKAVAHCEALGYRTFRLLAATDYRRVIQVYERCGFSRVGQVHLWGQDFYQYERVLPAPFAEH